ncbi:MAG: 4Fe-4S binding protein [Firmicutes bacterium]|nr:4Fe-4S binding protein [Lachnospiraceae bacterium]MDD6492874.1 4Fe-4S binding protein [Bacillota bacterium]
MIRLSGKAYAVAENEQIKWRDKIFEEQPYLANVYPGDTRSIGIIFCIDSAEIEYFNLGVNPIFRETYRLGDVKMKEKGYFITESCIGCGTCKSVCPQRCIEEGSHFTIMQNHCLHCGNCYENCPVKAIERRG